ncbi:MAG: hypothetical protein E5X54_32995 [Mesorhizobium sp.]|nr:MAG: hypothetical protein EOR48_26230 [Mesorhizobium sp.]TIM85345.1 MAG: hypothetical protein E5Y50_19070 [Mesorhizobium sp.]TIP41217.1 MAG: hypothetical protein E5X62_25960 [Mesorhizobium sp.]TIQ24829.1 MAG: hypothetical protein E5X54_32995 [Mesorhizobium sp.]
MASGEKICVFCRNPVRDLHTGRTRSREHVFPFWALKGLSAVRDLIEFSRMEAISADGMTAQLSEQTSIRRLDLNNFLLGDVCSKCNNGWMSALEARMKPILAKLTAKVALPMAEREVLAKWAMKTAYVLSCYLDPPVGRIPAKHGHQLVGDTFTLPKGVAVFYRYAADTRIWFSISLTLTVQGTDEEAVRRRYQNAYKVLLQLGAVQFMVMFYPDSAVEISYATSVATLAAANVDTVGEHPVDRDMPDIGDPTFRFMMSTEVRPSRSPKPVGRNDLCACGSALKYKHCHGAPEVNRRPPPSRQGWM